MGTAEIQKCKTQMSTSPTSRVQAATEKIEEIASSS